MGIRTREIEIQRDGLTLRGFQSLPGGSHALQGDVRDTVLELVCGFFEK